MDNSQEHHPSPSPSLILGRALKTSVDDFLQWAYEYAVPVSCELIGMQVQMNPDNVIVVTEEPKGGE
jgi:hypothetical protein